MTLGARVDAIESRLLRRLSKGVYYTVTLQLLRRLRQHRTYRIPALHEILPAGSTGLDVKRVRSRTEYESEMARPVWQARAAIERWLAEEHGDDEEIRVPGFSLQAGRTVEFFVRFRGELPDSANIPNWRARMICSHTDLSNRQRAMATLLSMYGATGRDVFLFEQLGSLYAYLREAGRKWNITGSEWLGPAVKPGTVINGIRHEDCVALSLRDNSMDIVMSLDVFEHVPDPFQGFREQARVLRPGGVMLMTIPFFPERDKTTQRARQVNGRIEHLLAPEYHANPLDREGGSLVYHEFGWDLLQMIRRAGFCDAYAGLYWSLEYGHLGAPQIIFVATK